VATEHDGLAHKLDEFELRQFLPAKTIARNAFVTIHSGAGGTESCDWADMLLGCISAGSSAAVSNPQTVDIQQGEEVGIKSVDFARNRRVRLRASANRARRGTALLRISPFDANKRRHTSFASVDVVPEIADTAPIEVNPADLEIGTFRSGGQRRTEREQGRNCGADFAQAEWNSRGLPGRAQQGRNRELAMKMLKAKLYQLEEDKKRAEIERQYGEKGEIAWGKSNSPRTCFSRIRW